MFKIIIVGLIVTVVGLFTLSKIDNATGANDSANVELLDSSDSNKDGMDIEIDGEVNHPGIYSMDVTQTLGDLISKAGGVTENADTYAYIPEFVIGDYNYFYIPPKAAEYCEPKEGEKVNINSSSLTASTLVSKLGVSQTVADAIMEYRKENGSFKALEELKNVKGIGDKTYEKIRGLVTLK